MTHPEPVTIVTPDLILFSFGTLQNPTVQQAVFGRALTGTPDTLPGHRLDILRITDPDVIALSGTAEHPLLRPSDNPGDTVDGTAYNLIRADLLAADDYEVPDYGRTTVTLGSGRTAWVYLDRRHLGDQPRRPSI